MGKPIKEREFIDPDTEFKIGDRLIVTDMRCIPKYYRDYFVRFDAYPITRITGHTQYVPFKRKVLTGFYLQGEQGVQVHIRLPTHGFVIERSEDEVFIRNLY